MKTDEFESYTTIRNHKCLVLIPPKVSHDSSIYGFFKIQLISRNILFFVEFITSNSTLKEKNLHSLKQYLQNIVDIAQSCDLH